MNDKYFKIIELLRRYYSEEATLEEEAELNALLNSHPEFQNLLYEYTSVKLKERHVLEKEICTKKALEDFDVYIGYRPRLRFRWVRYAAILLLPIAVCLFLFLEGNQKTVSLESSNTTAEKFHARLKLANGNVVLVGVKDSLMEISLAEGMRIINRKGVLDYSDSVGYHVEMQYNTLEIPRGGTYQVVLADGTVVYLNAETVLKYPVAFSNDKREVFLSGEAYFEVVKDSTRPFIVRAEDINVRVYGTTFNVNTYRKNRVQTTLIEGKVGISSSSTNRETILSPNEMAEYIAEDEIVKVRSVDPLVYIAWKSGEFMFDKERLENIMDQLARWYDINIFYVNESVKDLVYSGIADRFSKIEDVLAILECTGTVKFSLQDRTVIVRKVEK